MISTADSVGVPFEAVHKNNIERVDCGEAFEERLEGGRHLKAIP